jgi:hypothetical protein
VRQLRCPQNQGKSRTLVACGEIGSVTTEAGLTRQLAELAVVLGAFLNAVRALEHPPDPGHVDHSEVERTSAQRVDPVSVTVAQAQELVALPHPRPRKRHRQEPLGVEADVGAALVGAGYDGIHIAKRPRGLAGGVVGGVGRNQSLASKERKAAHLAMVPGI